jgi:hypothetical protein
VSSNVTETQNPNNSLPETLYRFLYAYPHAVLGVDEGIWESWQCVKGNLYALIACLYMGKQTCNEAERHKLLAASLNILLPEDHSWDMPTSVHLSLMSNSLSCENQFYRCRKRSPEKGMAS